MTVSELMQILKTLDGNRLVVAAKFEMGFEEIGAMICPGMLPSRCSNSFQFLLL